MLSTQVNFNAYYLQKLENIADSKQDVLVLSRCLESGVISSRCRGEVVYKYPEILQVVVETVTTSAGRLSLF